MTLSSISAIAQCRMPLEIFTRLYTIRKKTVVHFDAQWEILCDYLHQSINMIGLNSLKINITFASFKSMACEPLEVRSMNFTVL